MRWLALAFALLSSLAGAQTLRVGLAEDPDILDPTLARTFVGRIVFARLRDKLLDPDRIVLERFPNYGNKGQIHFEGIVYLPIVDATVRLANLRSGQLDFIERLAPSDVAGLKSDSRFKIDKIVEIGYQGITINTGKSELAQKNPLGKDARVREAFELSLDRDGIVQVAMDGEADKGNQWVAPVNRYYGKSAPIPKRDIPKARKLLAEAGVSSPSFTLMTPTTSDAQRIAPGVP